MDQRDMFAAAAMIALLRPRTNKSNDGINPHHAKLCASMAYDMAEIMVKESRKRYVDRNVISEVARLNQH